MSKIANGLQRFLFDAAAVRGEVVQLSTTWQTISQQRDYPPALQKMLGELLAAAVLLQATLKFDGSLIMQLQGDGILKLIVVECVTGHGVRAMASWDGEVTEDLSAMLGQGRFILTLDPKQGKPYQGIVSLEGNSVQEILSHYMQTSEQLDTRLWLFAADDAVAGLLLQKLPESRADEASNTDLWERVTATANTVRADELLQLEAEEVLYRLFHQETVRLLHTENIAFYCACSRPKVANMLSMLGEAEVREGLLEQGGQLSINCQFCNTAYDFNAEQALSLFQVVAPSSTRLQ